MPTSMTWEQLGPRSSVHGKDPTPLGTKRSTIVSRSPGPILKGPPPETSWKSGQEKVALPVRSALPELDTVKLRVAEPLTATVPKSSEVAESSACARS